MERLQKNITFTCLICADDSVYDQEKHVLTLHKNCYGSSDEINKFFIDNSLILATIPIQTENVTAKLNVNKFYITAETTSMENTSYSADEKVGYVCQICNEINVNSPDEHLFFHHIDVYLNGNRKINSIDYFSRTTAGNIYTAKSTDKQNLKSTVADNNKHRIINSDLEHHKAQPHIEEQCCPICMDILLENPLAIWNHFGEHFKSIKVKIKIIDLLLEDLDQAPIVGPKYCPICMDILSENPFAKWSHFRQHFKTTGDKRKIITLLCHSEKIDRLMEKLDLPVYEEQTDFSSDTASDDEKEIDTSEDDIYNDNMDYPLNTADKSRLRNDLNKADSIIMRITDSKQLRHNNNAATKATNVVSKNKSRTFKCKNCSTTFSRKYNLDRHLKAEVCTKINKYDCPKCLRQFRYQEACSKHSFFCKQL